MNSRAGKSCQSYKKKANDEYKDFCNPMFPEKSWSINNFCSHEMIYAKEIKKARKIDKETPIWLFFITGSSSLFQETVRLTGNLKWRLCRMEPIGWASFLCWWNGNSIIQSVRMNESENEFDVSFEKRPSENKVKKAFLQEFKFRSEKGCFCYFCTSLWLRLFLAWSLRTVVVIFNCLKVMKTWKEKKWMDGVWETRAHLALMAFEYCYRWTGNEIAMRTFVSFCFFNRWDAKREQKMIDGPKVGRKNARKDTEPYRARRKRDQTLKCPHVPWGCWQCSRQERRARDNPSIHRRTLYISCV